MFDLIELMVDNTLNPGNIIFLKNVFWSRKRDKICYLKSHKGAAG